MKRHRSSQEVGQGSCLAIDTAAAHCVSWTVYLSHNVLAEGTPGVRCITRAVGGRRDLPRLRP